MMFSELCKIMVNEVTFVGFSVGDRPVTSGVNRGLSQGGAKLS